MSTLVLVHLVGQIEHGEVELDVEPLAPTGDVVETVGVMSREVDGDDVAMVLHGLGDEGFLPLDVANHSVLTFARTQTSREHHHVLRRLKGGLDHLGEVAAVAPCLVDGHAKRSQSLETHQNVVNKIYHLAVELVADDGTECNAVLSAQGMVAHDGEVATVRVVGDGIQTLTNLTFNVGLYLSCAMQIA